jgi:hypothetical protein
MNTGSLMMAGIRGALVIAAAVLPGAFIFTAPLSAQSASAKDGNIYFTRKDGRTLQITSSGLDSDAHLSSDQRLVVFVRTTPSLKIDTGIGETQENELWIAETSDIPAPRRVLVGHAGGYNADGDLVLAGFGSPQFSPDARRIYFEAQTWVTSSSFRVLDLSSGKVRYLYNGGGIEVLQKGKYAGILIAFKEIPRVRPGRVFRYWLLDPDGKDIGEIGENESDVSEFKRELEDQN